MTNYLTRNDLWKERFMMTHSVRELSPSQWKVHGGRGPHGSGALKLTPLTPSDPSAAGSRKVTLRPMIPVHSQTPTVEK